MHFHQLPFLLPFFAATIGALPQGSRGPPNGGSPPGCLSSSDANKVANTWLQLIGNYSQQLAESTLAPNFTDYSASALSLNAVCPQAPGPAPPLGSPVFTNRTQFEEGQGPQPPIDGTALNITQGCTQVTMRYIMTNLGSRPVYAIIVLDVIQAPSGASQPWLIGETLSEFDSSAWISNLQDSGLCTKSS